MNVLLLADSGPLNLKVVYCLARMGARTHVLATSESNLVRRSRHVASFAVQAQVALEPAPDAAVERVLQACREHNVDVIVPGDIGTAEFLADAEGSLGTAAAIYPCSDARMLQAIHDKWSFAKRLMAAGIAAPETAHIASLADVETAAATVGFPLIVKPLSGESSHGVVRIDSLQALHAHVKSGKPYSAPPLIAQRWVRGRDIDISVLANRGEILAAVTQQAEPDGSLRFFEDRATRELATQIVREFGYHGIAHFDMRRDEDRQQTVVIECNPRFWYSMPAALWQGVNFVELGIRFALGQSVGNVRVMEGMYFLPGAMIGKLRRGRIPRMSLRNLRGVLQPALDPMPHLADALPGLGSRR